MSSLTYPVGRGEIGTRDGPSGRDNACANVMEIMRSSLCLLTVLLK